jgi:hypothetical protein
MNDQRKLEIAKVSNELWNDNLWYRQLKEDEKDSVAHTVWLIRNNRIKGKMRFAEIMSEEINALIKSRN